MCSSCVLQDKTSDTRKALGECLRRPLLHHKNIDSWLDCPDALGREELSQDLGSESSGLLAVAFATLLVQQCVLIFVCQGAKDIKGGARRALLAQADPDLITDQLREGGVIRDALAVDARDSLSADAFYLQEVHEGLAIERVVLIEICDSCCL